MGDRPCDSWTAGGRGSAGVPRAACDTATRADLRRSRYALKTVETVMPSEHGTSWSTQHNLNADNVNGVMGERHRCTTRQETRGGRATQTRNQLNASNCSGTFAVRRDRSVDRRKRHTTPAATQTEERQHEITANTATATAQPQFLGRSATNTRAWVNQQQTQGPMAQLLAKRAMWWSGRRHRQETNPQDHNENRTVGTNSTRFKRA